MNNVNATSNGLQAFTIPTTLQAPEEHLPLTPESLLFFCQSRLQSMDDAIHRKMQGQKDLVALQALVGNISGAMKTAGKGTGNDVAFDDPEKIQAVCAQLDEAIALAEKCGQSADVLQNLKNVKAKVLHGGDSLVGNDELKAMNEMLDTASSSCRSGAEVSMIELQSIVSQRATLLQLTTGMMNSVNEASKTIAANIGR